MGYTAKGDGSVELKTGVDIQALEQLLDDTIEESGTELEYEIDRNTIFFWEHDTHWDDDGIMDFLDALIPYITDGYAEYNGDEGCNWRYIFHGSRWEEQDGMVYYTMEDMIKELEAQGYMVTKAREAGIRHA